MCASSRTVTKSINHLGIVAPRSSLCFRHVRCATRALRLFAAIRSPRYGPRYYTDGLLNRSDPSIKNVQYSALGRLMIDLLNYPSALVSAAGIPPS